MSIHLRYLGGLIEKDALENIKSNLSTHKIDLVAKDNSGALMMSVEELVAPVAIMLSSDVVQAYILGLSTNASYDLIKHTVISIWNQISGKKYTKFNHRKSEELEANFDLHIESPGKVRVQFKLKGNIPNELKDKCVDNAFKLINENAFPEIRTGYISNSKFSGTLKKMETIDSISDNPMMDEKIYL